jgi:undecaprenyl-diphosphatase
VGLSYAGSYGILWLAIALAAAVFGRRPLLVPAVAAAVLIASLSSSALKSAVDRSRPAQQIRGLDVLGPEPSSPSFPSGHATTSFAAAVLLAVLVPRLAPVVLALAAAVALSRVYVGAHFPLDVVAGTVLGALVATALLLCARALRGSRSRLMPDRPTDPPRDSPSRRTDRGSR